MPGEHVCGGKAPGEEPARAECRNAGKAGRCRGAAGWAVPWGWAGPGSAVGPGRAVPWGGRAGPGQAGTGVRADAQGVARKRTTDDGQPATAVKTGICLSISKWK